MAKTESLSSRPKYEPGQKPKAPYPSFGEKVHVFDPSKLATAYFLTISSGAPRPIALVSSTNPETGVDNVAPHSYFGVLSHDPPMVAVGFARNHNGEMKDSIKNVLAKKEFAINIMSEWYLDAANHTSGGFSPETDEFVESGLTKAPCEVVTVPRVAEAGVTYECKVEHVYPVLKDKAEGSTDADVPTTEIVMARVVRIHVDDTVMKKVKSDSSDSLGFNPLIPEVDTELLRPIGRLGGNVYTTLGELLDIPPPSVTK